MALTSEQENAIERLYKEKYGFLLAYAQNALRSRELAQEAVQDTFRIACSKPEALLSCDNPQGWLTLTLKYVIKRIWRYQTKLSSMIVSSMSVEDTEIVCQDDGLVEAMCSDLIPAEDYKLLKMVAMEDYSMLEAANELGISVVACRKRAQRAKAKLRNILLEKEK